MFAISWAYPHGAAGKQPVPLLAGTTTELCSSLLSIAALSWLRLELSTPLTLPDPPTVAAAVWFALIAALFGDRTAQFVPGMLWRPLSLSHLCRLAIPPDVDQQSPQLTATVGVYMMLVTFATLILLIQHISTMLQAPNIAVAGGVSVLCLRLR